MYTCAEEQVGLATTAIEKWREKGPYESTTEWQQRTSSLNTDIRYRQLINELSKNLLAETELTIDYNADTEVFTFHASCFADFQLKVPRSEASCFEQNFRKENIQSLVFGYQTDTRNIVVDSIIVGNPCNQQAYKFPPPADSNRAVADIAAGDSTAFQSREINIVNQLEVRSKTIEVRFFDNGSVDGDIISIYFNGRLLQQRQTLSSSPIRFTLQLKENEENIIAMFAENLGSIPPNTALMVVDDGGSIVRIPLESNMQQSGAIKITVANSN